MSLSKQAGPEEAFFDTSKWIKASWYRAVQPLLEKALSIEAINQVAREAYQPGMSCSEFADALLRLLGVEWSFDVSNLPPRDGQGWLVLANHPTGFIEALVLMKIMAQVAPDDWHLLGNEFAANKAQFKKRIIALDPFNKGGSRKTNLQGLREASKRLRHGEVVGAFPAGRVSAGMDASGHALDQPWSPHFLRMVRKTGARIIVVKMPWSPGRVLRTTPVQLPALRALLLSREAFRHRDEPVEVVMKPAPTELADDLDEGTQQLQDFCHELRAS